MIHNVGTYHNNGKDDEQHEVPESYRPSRVTKAFKLLQGSRVEENMEVGTMIRQSSLSSIGR